jgi:hypothetical protein
MLISNCCGAAIKNDQDTLCPKCKEHCEFIDEDSLEDDGSLDLPNENEL